MSFSQLRVYYILVVQYGFPVVYAKRYARYLHP